MYERKIMELHGFFDKRVAECKAQEKVLTEDGRFDEAIFEKVRGNVFEIFKTVLDAGVKVSAGNQEKLEQFLGGKLEEIPQNWRVSLQKAEENGDLAKVHMEHIKLEVLDEIKVAFNEIWSA